MRQAPDEAYGYAITCSHLKKSRASFLLLLPFLFDCLGMRELNYAMNCKMILGSRHGTTMLLFSCYLPRVIHQQLGRMQKRSNMAFI